MDALAMRRLDVMPSFSTPEKRRYLQLTSLHFNEFYNNGNPRACQEKYILFKANRLLENNLDALLEMDPESSAVKPRKYAMFLKLGHISLLAQDWAKALSAYQHAYNLYPDEFWKHPGNYYGLGLVYLHFKEYKLAAESFSRLLYCYPSLDNIVEVKVRLGVCYQNLSEYTRALKFFNQALSDVLETPFMSKIHIRFNMALSNENLRELDKAQEEYNSLLHEVNPNNGQPLHMQLPPQQIQLIAAIYRQLGWIMYRRAHEIHVESVEEKHQRLQEAEQFLSNSKKYEPENGKTFYYLGRCYGETQNKAHEAFVNYRQSIDKSEADADTWCSIGVLYQQQNQPMDALQAFICAVELDPEHSAAWTDLGILYELHSQFADALACFRKATKYNPVAPEPLKARILVLEKEPLPAPPPPSSASSHTQPPNQSNSSTPGAAAGPTSASSSGGSKNQSAPTKVVLPSLKDAWHQPIPSELRGRQEEFLKVKQHRYRDGSVIWRMGELAAPLEGMQEAVKVRPLESTQLQMLRLLQMNRERINEHEKKVLEELECRYKLHEAEVYEPFLTPHTMASLPCCTEAELNMLKETGHFILQAAQGTKNNPQNKSNNTTPTKGNDDFESSEAKIHTAHVKCEEPDQDLSITSTSELPTTFSMLSQINVPHDISSAELLEQCHKRVEQPSEFRPVFDEECAPPVPPNPCLKGSAVPPPAPSSLSHPLLRPTPLVVVESRKDAQSSELQKFCESAPIALIRGLTSVLKMDLSLFSTKTLLEVAADQEVEVRTQYRMPCDLNVDHLGAPTWHCMSTRSFTTIQKYATYQAETFKHSLKEESEKLRQAGAKYMQQQAAETNSAKKRRGPNGDEYPIPTKILKFGTNVDLSDDVKWKTQLQELAKMPPFCRLIAGCNMLSHLGHTVLGMNTVQLYMKVPGSRTPAHQENNSFASININIGPGDCEWYACDYQYWGTIEQMCRKKNIDFLRGSYWPNMEDLLEEGVPVYKFTQKAGDLVWVGGGVVHWVQATGWCNNIAWNVAPMTHNQMQISLISYEWNKLQNYKSLVPLQHLAWQLAKNIRFTNQKMFNLLRGILIRSLAFCKMVADFAQSHGKSLKPQARQKGEITHYCTLCEVEVFNILFVKEVNGKFPVYCVYCARRCGLEDFIVLQQVAFPDLQKIFDEMTLNLIPKATLLC